MVTFAALSLSSAQKDYEYSLKNADRISAYYKASNLAEEKLAVVLGTEGDGLADGTIADCDYTVKIPMYHGVDSLNVAAASAVAFWQLGNRGKV